MSHVVLLGDSIFDNARYVPGGPAVVEQVQAALPPGWRATLLAVDGSITTDVPLQLKTLPADATHLVISVGGNDALGWGGLTRDTEHTAAEGFVELGRVRDEFLIDYAQTLKAVLAAGKPVTVCTVYDSVPGLPRSDVAVLAVFNEAILRHAAAAGVPVIDLRLICTAAADYAPMSPIEPSRVGGAKIASAIARVVTKHDFAAGGCRVYGPTVG